MSAFIVNYHHINALINWAASHEVKVLRFYNVKHHEDEIGQILWDENYRSCNHRYGEKVKPEKYKFKLSVKHFKPIQIIKACDCYNYQACENSDYEESEAHQIINSIRSNAWHLLPGYDKADWEIKDSLGLHGEVHRIVC